MPIIKTEFSGESRLLELAQPSHKLLADLVAERYNLIPGSFSFEFRDDEGDDCAITSDAELMEALRLSVQQNLTIIIKGGQSAPAKPVVEPVQLKFVAGPEPERPDVVEPPASPTTPVVMEPVDQAKVTTPFTVVRVAQPQEHASASVPFCSVDRTKRSPGRFATSTRGSGYTVVSNEGTTGRRSSTKQDEDEQQKEEARVCDEVHSKESTRAQGCQSVPPEFIQELQNFLTENAVRVSEAINTRADVVFSGLALGHRARDILEKLITCDAFLSQHHWVTSRFLPTILPRMSPYFDRLVPLAKAMICSFIARIPTMLVLTPGVLESIFKEEENQAVHHGFLCDGCGSDPIRGTRFRCTVRPNYDLCEACEKRDTTGYSMTKIKVPVKSENEQENEQENEGPEQKERDEKVDVVKEEPIKPQPVAESVVQPVVQQPAPVVQPIIQPVVAQPVQPVVPIKMPVAQPVPVVPVAQPARTRKFEQQIQILRGMGFNQDDDVVEALLQTEGGDVQKVMDVLLR